MWRNLKKKLKAALTTTIILGFPNYVLPFILEVNSLCQGLCSILSEMQDEKRRILAYASPTLRPSERSRKSDSKLEILVVKWALFEKFRSYVLGAEVEIYTNNR